MVGEFYIPSYVIQDESGDQTPDAPFHQPMEKEEEWAETPGSAEEILEELREEENSDDPA